MPYTAFPLQVANPNAATAEKCHSILSAFLGHENFFTDYRRACDEQCGECEQCIEVKQYVAATLTDPKSLCWEVWKEDDDGDLVDIVGILRLSRIDPGEDALAHYFFFDHRLSDKTDLLEWWRQWAFTDHDGWIALNRVTVEVPEYAFALARHAVKKLDFGGPYSYELDGKEVPVEGVRRDAKTKNGERFDMLILGLVNDAS